MPTPQTSAKALLPPLNNCALEQVNVLAIALQLIGYELLWFDGRKEIESIGEQLQDASLIGLIVNRRTSVRLRAAVRCSMPPQ